MSPREKVLISILGGLLGLVLVFISLTLLGEWNQKVLLSYNQMIQEKEIQKKGLSAPEQNWIKVQQSLLGRIESSPDLIKLSRGLQDKWRAYGLTPLTLQVQNDRENRSSLVFSFKGPSAQVLAMLMELESKGPILNFIKYRLHRGLEGALEVEMEVSYETLATGS